VRARRLLVSYDVVDDRTRARLAKFLSGYLDRVQKSVFEGVIGDEHVEVLRRGVRETIDQDVDSVRVYFLCARCESATEVIGSGVVVESEDGDVLI
jgi:CRISPR-associated protein Cas2